MPKRLLGFLFPAAAARGDETWAEPPQLDAIADAQARGQVYISDLPADIEPARRLLRSYSGIRAKDVDGHIQTIRDKLWEIYPYVCVGHFRFLSLQFTSDPQYRQALGRLLVPRRTDGSGGETGVTRLLDVGCCVGQALRQLAHDGVDPHRLYGVDVEPRFTDLGYELFRDRHRFAATFVVGDLLKVHDDDDDKGGGSGKGLRMLRGRMDIIYATSFFHLFPWGGQVRAAKRMVGFLKPDDPDVMIFGRQVGTSSPLPAADREARGQRFLHNAQTWQELWDEVGTLTGTRWRAELEFLDQEDIAMGGAEGAVRRARFGVYRA